MRLILKLIAAPFIVLLTVLFCRGQALDAVCRCMGGGYLVVEIHQFEKSKLKTNIFFEFVSSGIPFTSINFVSFHIINN